MSLNLEGKRVLITGGASGIGRATAGVLASYGALVVLADMSEALLDDAKAVTGAKAFIAGDVTSEDACRMMAAEMVRSCGGIDALIHCAGISDRVAKAFDIEIEEWQRIVDVTLRGTFLINRSVAQLMIAQKKGAIVNFSSVNGLGGFPRRYAYGPGKAAVAALTRSLACEWSPDGIRVNALAPGYVRTPMIERLSAEGKIDVEKLEGRTPMGRLAGPSEIANAAAFLISDLASYITGVTLPVDGGWTAFGGPGDVKTA